MGGTLMNKLSIIMPFCNEYPQVVFTVQIVWNELKKAFSNQNFELIIIDNFCDSVTKQKTGEEFCPNCMSTFKKFRTRDKGSDFLRKQSKLIPQIKYIAYNKKLSHWNAKNVGVANSTGDVLLFLDAHVVPSSNSIKEMFEYYITHYEELNGTLHLPLAYLLAAPGTELIYNFVSNPDKGYYHYSFAGYRREEKPYKVAAMSTCGMMMSREIFDKLGGWPSELGIYGGGENFINFTLAVLGMNKYIMTTGPLYHYADTRGYEWNYDDFIRNRTIATYIFAGEEAAYKFVQNCRGNKNILENIYKDAIVKTKNHREYIKERQQISIKEWMIKIQKEGLWDGKLSNKEWVD